MKRRDIELQQVERDMLYPTPGRWRILTKTSPSGKTLFVCLSCGEVAPTTTPDCPEPVLTLDRTERRCKDWKPSPFEVQ